MSRHPAETRKQLQEWSATRGLNIGLFSMMSSALAANSDRLSQLNEGIRKDEMGIRLSYANSLS